MVHSSKGDRWFDWFDHISGTWAKNRKQSSDMRSILERLFDKPFPKVRPNFLRSSVTKRCLELDAYCEELKLAAEMNGIGHSVWPNPFHATRDKFEAQLERDARKAQLCAQHGIKLVVVPHEVSRDELEAFLVEQFRPELTARDAAVAVAQVDTAAANAPAATSQCHDSQLDQAGCDTDNSLRVLSRPAAVGLVTCGCSESVSGNVAKDTMLLLLESSSTQSSPIPISMSDPNGEGAVASTVGATEPTVKAAESVADAIVAPSAVADLLCAGKEGDDSDWT
jgi:hypothetical protein